MSLLDNNVNIKILDINFLSWGISSVYVAPRKYHALVFRVKGKASFSHNGYTEKTEEGDVFYMPANYGYYASYEEENEILVIHFEADIKGQMENYKSNAPELMRELFKKAYTIWENKGQAYYYSCAALVYEIMAKLNEDNVDCCTGEAHRSFLQAVQYMKDHYTDADMSIEKLVEMSHMSNTYFRKLFFRKFGINPIQYLQATRLKYAEKLLATGMYSIEEAAKKSGFNDTKYFSRIVKNKYGVPPSKLYRHTDFL